MSRTLYIAIACDADPDVSPTVRRADPGSSDEPRWRGVEAGIPALRRRLDQTRFVSGYGQPPISWLVRCDRQIYELYGGDAAWCVRRFEAIWNEERRLGSELGWHPHLYRWHKASSSWRPWLGADDDVEMLAECLAQLRRHADVRAVRTGWDYQSNRLIELFARSGLQVDASAIPGSVQAGEWAHSWGGAPRGPYLPSRRDYRREASSAEDRLPIVELPVLVRCLPRPLQAARYGLRTARRLRLGAPELTGAEIARTSGDTMDWDSARWQGVLISRHPAAFRQAVAQTLSARASSSDSVFVTTYFHSGELLEPSALERFVSNLEAILDLGVTQGWELVPTTLTGAGTMAGEKLRTPEAFGR